MRRAGGLGTGGAACARRREVALCRRECAAAYHQLHQVHLRSDADRDSHLMGFFLAMAAVNLAEASSQQDLPSNFKSHSYALLALRIRHSTPRIFKYLSRFVCRFILNGGAMVSNSFFSNFPPGSTCLKPNTDRRRTKPSTPT